MRHIEELGEVEVPNHWERCILSNVKDHIKARDILRFHLGMTSRPEATLPLPIQVVFQAGGRIVIHNHSENGVSNAPLTACLGHLYWDQEDLEVIFE